MFDVELAKLILKRKEENLQELQSNATPDQNEIDNLNKEINYLKATIIRYEIAKLLKLHTNQEYMSNYYLGIENEDINDYDLSPEEISEYNNLISQLPKEQLVNYKLRKQAAKILGEENSKEFAKDDYVGIEKINPKLDKYDLTDQQIEEFKQLVEKINNSIADSTKKVDITQETVKLLDETFNKLNVENLDEYDRLKAMYMDTLENIINHIQQESRNKIHATAKNCNLAIDLREKYPELQIILSVTAAKQLLNVLEHEKLDEEKYNDYLDYLCKNINELYQDDNNKEEIVNLLNSVDKNNYILRNDLKNKLPNIEGVTLELQDDELETLFKFLDQNYDSLEEKESEKYYSILTNKLNTDIDNLNKINSINKLMLSITNKNFGERLQTSFASKDTVKFKHQHYTSHKELINDKIKELQKKIQLYESKKPKTGIMATYYDTKIADLQKEIKKLESIDEHTFKDTLLLEELDNEYNNKTDKIIKIRKEIADLQELKNRVNSTFHKRIIDKKIQHRENKLKKLKESKTKIVGNQKRIMAPKLYLQRKEGLFSRHFESKEEVFTKYSEDYKQMAEAERKMNGFFSGIKAAFYDFKAGRYESKAKFNKSLVEMLKGGKVKVTGSNKGKINKNDLNTIRNNQNQQVATQTM